MDEPGASSDWPSEPVLARLARDTLLDHLHRGHARHALRHALSTLSALLGADCSLLALDEQGRVRWSLGRAADAGSHDTQQSLPLWRLGQCVGMLRLPQAGRGPAGDRLDALLPTLAALLLDDDRPGVPTDTKEMAIIRAALVGADTFVWEWDLDNDWLGEIDEGLRVLGHDPDVHGRTQEDWNRLIHPDDLPANQLAYQRYARGETEQYEHRYRVRAADGSWRWYLERGRFVEWHGDGRPLRMAGIQSDLTSRMAIEASASDATARLERIADHVPGMLFQFAMQADGSATFRFVSARAKDWFGIEPALVMATPQLVLYAIEPAQRRAVFDSIVASRDSLSEWRQEFRVHCVDGQWRWLLGAATPQPEDGGTVAWHGYFEDVTQRRDLERARQDAAVAEAASRAKTEFLSRISHELRTPLNAVLGFTQLLEIDPQEPPTEGQKRRLKLIHDAGDHLLQMIGDLLDLTRIDSGALALTLQAVPLRALVHEVFDMLQDAASQARVQLILEPDGDDADVRADPTRLRQVLLNLVSNAIKYNRRGGQVRIELEQRPAGSVSVRVRDTGTGVIEADRARLFEPFHRGRHAHGKIDGSGLGLSLTRSLVTLMRGTVELADSSDQGSMFRLTLPRA